MQHSPFQVHARSGRRPSAYVVRDPTPDEVVGPVDWPAWYLPDEDDMGEACEQGDIIRTVLSSLGQLAVERRWSDVYLGADTFFAWVPKEPLVRVSPDVYILESPPPRPLPKSFQTWLAGHRPPSWAAEIVSEDWRKDYDQAPEKYAQLGVRELVIFDPEVALAGGNWGPRAPLQVYQRAEDGAFVRCYIGNGPARSDELDAYLVARREGGAARLRIARDLAGRNIVPTADEAKRAADDRIRALEAELARVRAGR
jgi:Putative restriction endonuclease